jgi:RNA polymerase sigma-54 factor
LQIDEAHPQHELHRELILHHLEDIEHNRLPRVAKKLSIGMEVLKQTVAYICSMDPAPGRIYDFGQVPYMMTDVIVEMIDGRYEVYLNESTLPRLRISPTYRRMIRHTKTGTEEHEFLKKKIEAARWLVDAIQQRKETLLKISREIVRAQEEFLEKGIPGLKAMKMQDVADATGVHVSTVSRAISQKNMQTAWGIFPIKFFFSGSMKTTEGEDETWSAVKNRIKEIIDTEDKKNPLSDEDILAKLSGTGLQIARRTVTKYRKILKIPSSRQRKEY